MSTPSPVVAIKTTTEVVTDLLQNNVKKEIYKDDDEKLVAAIWAREIIALKKDPNVLKKITALEFLELYSEGDKLTPAETIMRARRRAQESDARLRGTKWNQRHGAAKDVKENIHNG